MARAARGGCEALHIRSAASISIDLIGSRGLGWNSNERLNRTFYMAGRLNSSGRPAGNPGPARKAAQPDPTSADTKTRILDAAELLFTEHGFEATSLRSLTAAAGV